MQTRDEIEERLRAVRAEEKDLLAKLVALETRREESVFSSPLGSPARDSVPRSIDEKLSLFRELFACRENVYPKLWHNRKTGAKGYSPACNNEWVREVCGKPSLKCSECPNQSFPTLDTAAMRKHLEGHETIGTYAIREDDSCIFLATDFDGGSYQEDSLAFKQSARELGIVAEIERSRSGEGAHVWIFFSEFIPASHARRLGTAILSRATAIRHTIGLGAFDRFFPNQDLLPKGGFGNLIALPLQKKPRELGNSVFVDETFQAHIDQWAILAGVRRLSRFDVDRIFAASLPPASTFNLALVEDHSVAEAERMLNSGRRKIVRGAYSGQVDLELGSRLKIKLADLPSSIVSAFKRIATFANPKFFELERLRFSTWKTPRYIFCGELEGENLVVPRGILDACLEIAKEAGAQVVLRDHRPKHKKIKANFHGELISDQKKAIDAIYEFETGVLMAPPGAGKTVMACALIAKRRVPTIVLVHRTPLLEQWRSQLARFLSIPEKEIGVIASTRRKPTGKVDVAMIQTISSIEDATELLGSYEQVIIDECHHIPAVSFEAVLKKAPARYFLGLTATPYRKDGHQVILHMHCGPIRYEMKSVGGPPLAKRVIVRETAFRMEDKYGPQPPIHEVWAGIVADKGRTTLIAQDVIASSYDGRFPLVISDRKQHLDELSEQISSLDVRKEMRHFLFVGGLGKKARARMLTEIQALLSSGGRPYILATGSFIGEGFDLPQLDTLVLAMPLSFKGRLVQYAGRLHRPAEGKTAVQIFDYADVNSALTISMLKKRISAYKKLEYAVELPAGLSMRGDLARQKSGLFSLPR